MAKGNHRGVKGNKGGSLHRNKLELNLSGFEDLIVKLDELVDDVRPILTDALEQAAETVETDTRAAVNRANMPAGGRYSTGDTERSIVENARAEWSGTIVEVGLGFDKTKRGAGGFLITGTPRMRPDRALEDIYARKKYMKDLQTQVGDALSEAIIEKMEGR